MNMSERIHTRIRETLNTAHIELVNESALHRGGGSDSHWNLLVVSDDFQGKALVRRHQRVYQALAAEMKEGIHALTLTTLTSDEWNGQSDAALQSPTCGGAKHQH